LAAYRCEQGLPALSLAWGLWAPETGGMTGELSGTDLDRAARSGFTALTAARGMALLDAALATSAPFAVPLPIDERALASGDGGAGGVPAVLRGLVRAPAAPPRRTAEAAGGAAEPSGPTLEQRLAELPPAEQQEALVSLVRTEAAAVLGHQSGDQIDPDKSFSEIGFDSLTSVELRNRLGGATGLRLPATLVFDHPNAVAIAEYVGEQLLPEQEPVESQVMQRLDDLARLLGTVPESGDARSAINVRLQRLVEEWRSGRAETEQETQDVRAAKADELFALIDKGL
ncbi:acyl carrier protein, partial [Streptomonospora sediminis]